jgi:hypothetical protein
MPHIDNPTLVMAIQAVAAEIRSLRKFVQGDDADPEIEELLEQYEQAADGLEDAYDEAAKTAFDLPPYDELVGG